MRIKVQIGEDKQSCRIVQVESQCTWEMLCEMLNVSSNSQLKRGVRCVDFETVTASMTLEELALSSGDYITISQPKSMLRVKTMADDNSCLFSSVAYLLMDGAVELASELRSLAASLIASNPVEYNEAILGRDPQEYVQWIRQMNSWGGAIELAVFARHFGVQIASVDVGSLRLDVFGSDLHTKSRIYVLYSGIHYDAIEAVDGRKVFDADDKKVYEQVMLLAAKEQVAGRYTDMAKFTLKCDDCGQALKGQMAAQEHSQTTKHCHFSEYK